MKHAITLLLFTAYLAVGPLPPVATTCVRAQTYVSVDEQDTQSAALLALAVPGARYDVVNYKITYTTTDALGMPDTASGMLAVPRERSLRFPIGVYMHGTVTDREQVPSRSGTRERILVDALATVGYITVAPDYIGLGDSEGFHPYVHAESEASAGRDLVLAAKQWMLEQNIEFNEQLFITGYSQGGHAAMAMHRDIQENPSADSLRVTAGAHLSGPYSISDVMREAALTEELTTLPGFIIYTYISYNNVYSIYDSLGAAFVEPYLSVIEDYNEELIDGNRFNDSLTVLLEAREERLVDMFQDSVRIQLETNDDNSAIVQALRLNDTYQWAPQSPTLIYYCTADEQVPFENAILADSVMRDLGSTMVELLSGGARSHGDCVIPAVQATLGFFNQFAVAEPVVAVGQVLDLPGLSLSPNPVRKGAQLRITGLETGVNYRYQLTDVTGRLLQEGLLPTDGNLGIASSAGSGLHLLRIVQPDGNFAVRKLIVR